MYQEQLRPLPTPEKLDSLRKLTHVLYALYAFSWLSGLTAVVAIIINYIKREETVGTLYESHFRWQMQTFWCALGVSLVAGILCLTILLIPIGMLMFGLLMIWLIYRIAKGWLYLNDGRPIGDSIPTLY